MEKIKKDKFLYISIIILYVALVYSSFNTFLMNDDLPYSFFYRSNVRITNIIQVIKHQMADYLHINGRVIIHAVLQTLLIFGKNLWAILNPLMIVLSIMAIIKIINIYIDNKYNVVKFFVISSLFLLLISFKYIIYWGAGSLNYVWTACLLLWLIYYYLKKGFLANKYLNALLIFIVAILHESLLVFIIIFLFANILYELYNKEKIKKENFLYILMAILGLVYTITCPGNQIRLQANSEWANLNLIEKMQLSIPIISRNILNLKNSLNIIPYFFITAIVLGLYRIKNKVALFGIFSLLTTIFLEFLTDNNILYFVLVIILFLSELYLNYKNERLKLSVIQISMYAVTYSMMLTIEYISGRPNYFFFLYMVLSGCIILFATDLLKKNIKLITALATLSFVILVTKEVLIYTKIGQIHRERMKAIEEYKTTDQKVLYLKRIPKYLENYHIDVNQPATSAYFAHRYYLNYYGLSPDTVIQFVIEFID